MLLETKWKYYVHVYLCLFYFIWFYRTTGLICENLTRHPFSFLWVTSLISIPFKIYWSSQQWSTGSHLTAARVAAVKWLPVLHCCVVYTLWSFVIIELGSLILRFLKIYMRVTDGALLTRTSLHLRSFRFCECVHCFHQSFVLECIYLKLEYRLTITSQV